MFDVVDAFGLLHVTDFGDAGAAAINYFGSGHSPSTGRSKPDIYKAKSGSIFVKGATVSAGAFMAYDGWKRVMQPVRTEDGASVQQSWVGMVESAAGVALMAYGLLH